MNDSFLDHGQPNLKSLVEAFNRCAPTMPGGVDWLDSVRLCNGPEDSPDGRKHAVKGDPKSRAHPWENASNCKPFTADDVVNELTARNTVAFWRAMIQRGASLSEESAYAVSLVEHLVFGPLLAQLDKETELSSQFFLGRGWCLLAPRWKTEFGLKRFELKLATIQQTAAAAAQQLQQMPPNAPPDQVAQLQRVADSVNIILDPTRDAEAQDFLTEWYYAYTTKNLPEKFIKRVPKVRSTQLNRVLKGLRGSDQKAVVAIPYLRKNQLEITALEPWREVALPNEYTDAQELVFQFEYLTPATLEARELSEGYDPEWVAEAKLKAKTFDWQNLPTRSQPASINELIATQANPAMSGKAQLVGIVHAVYLANDEDGIPGVYCTTFHPDLSTAPRSRSADRPFVAKHELVEDIEGGLPYVDLVLEWRTRAVTSSRSVTERVSSSQKLIKDTLDQIVDAASIRISPPVNVYESPTGASYAVSGPAIGDLQFGPGSHNRFRRKETAAEFMNVPGGAGLADGVEVVRLVEGKVNNRFGLMSEDVPPPRMQMLQEKGVRRFLLGWTRAFVYGLALCQKNMDDAEFARITGAPAGWLDERRDTPGLLTSIFEFDVRELDSEQFAEQVKAFNSLALPVDSLRTVQTPAYVNAIARGIFGPRVARTFVAPAAAASTQLKDKAELQVLKMFNGTPPILMDKDDPSAATLLDETKATVLGNPKFTMALTPEALQAVAGQETSMVLMNMKDAGVSPKPDPLFSNLLMQWVQNLTFIGVTQQRNKQIGRQGVDTAGTNSNEN